MGQVEVVLVAVLIVLAGLLGLLFGGAGAWFMKPEAQTKIIDRPVNRYVCYDGSEQSDKSQCPKVTASGECPKVECPPCTSTGGSQDIVYRDCDCATAKQRCGFTGAPSVTTTTIWTPTCTTCNSDLDCGQESSEPVCKSGKEYTLVYKPQCKDGCCINIQNMNYNRECGSGERCGDSGTCEPYEDAE